MKHHHNREPLVVVQNLNSTRFDRVERDVIRPLNDAGITFESYHTRYGDAKDNIKAMIDELPDRGTVISAAGDGTADQVMNAVLRGKKVVTLGFLPYGNFNDMARAHMGRRHSVIDVLNAPTVDVHPLTVEVDDEYLQHASVYVTLGMTARIAAGFSDPQSREQMQQASPTERVVRRLGQAVGDFIVFRGQPLPAFRANGGQVESRSTDVAIANNPIVAGMIRPREPFYDTPYFGVRTDLNMGSVSEATSFGTLSLAGRSPLERVETLNLEFEKASRVPMQAAGEYRELEDARRIFIYKHPDDVVRVLHSK